MRKSKYGLKIGTQSVHVDTVVLARSGYYTLCYNYPFTISVYSNLNTFLLENRVLFYVYSDMRVLQIAMFSIIFSKKTVWFEFDVGLIQVFCLFNTWKKIKNHNLI